MPYLSSSNNPWIEDAVEGISGQNIYVDPDVSGGAALTDALASVVPGDGSIAVVGEKPGNTCAPGAAPLVKAKGPAT